MGGEEQLKNALHQHLFDMYTPGGYTETMTQKKISNRLSRIKGQIESLEANIAAAESCEKVIPQFLAVKGGLDAAFAAYMEDAITQCSKKDKAQIEKLIKILITK